MFPKRRKLFVPDNEVPVLYQIPVSYQITRTRYICWRAYDVPVVSSKMAWHCIVYSLHVLHYDVVSPHRSFVTTDLHLARMKNQHEHEVCWMSTGNQRLNVKNTHIPPFVLLLKLKCSYNSMVDFLEFPSDRIVNTSR